MNKFFAGILSLGLLFSTGAFAEKLDRRIVVHNNTSKRVVELYAAPIDYEVHSNGNMIRGPGDYILVGSTKVADIDDNSGYCRYHILAVLADGRTVENWDMNVCKIEDWYISD